MCEVGLTRAGGLCRPAFTCYPRFDAHRRHQGTRTALQSILQIHWDIVGRSPCKLQTVCVRPPILEVPGYSEHWGSKYASVPFLKKLLSMSRLQDTFTPLESASFCIKQNIFVAVRPSFYSTTACWRPWNCKRLKLGSRAQSFETATFFPAV